MRYVNPSGAFGRRSSRVTCPFCQETVDTRTEKSLNDIGRVSVGLIFVLGLS